MIEASSRVGVVGLGIMGSAIARNLVKAGRKVIGYDIDTARASALQDDGIAPASSVDSMATQVKVILTCLPHAGALNETIAALLRAAGAQSTIIAELSTLALDIKISARDRLGAAKITLLDCPLSGTGAQAVTGDLAVFASGDKAAWEACAPIAADFARVSHYLGAFGNGTKMKFVANLLVAIHNVAAAEAVLLGLRAGLDPESLVAVAGSGAGASRMLALRGPMMVEERFTPATMKLNVWQKDLDLISRFAESYGVSTPTFAASKSLYETALAQNLGEADTAAVFEVLAKMTKAP